MKVRSEGVRLVDFVGIDSIKELLRRVGVEPDLGRFLAGHLQHVLQQQYADLRLESIRLISVDQCAGSGPVIQDKAIARIDSLKIPILVEVVAVVQAKRYCLQLDVTIRAKTMTTGCKVESDVIIRRQSMI
jgi:hypothetical protein